MNQQKTKLLIVGPSLSFFTGFGYIASSIMKRFQQTGNYEIAYYVISGPENNPQMFSVYGDDFALMFKDLYSWNGQIQLQETYNNFNGAIEQFRPDIVFTVTDIWNLESVICTPFRSSFLLIVYATIETNFYPEYAMFPSLYNSTIRKSIKELFQRCDVIIPVTEMGRQALANMGVTQNVTKNIYNGIDFNKRFSKKLTKKDVYGNFLNEDDFLFISVSENSDRKLLDRTIYAFKLFLSKVQNPEKYKLYLHTNFADIKGGTDIVSMITDNQLERNVLLPSNFINNQFMPTEVLYSRYSVADCYLSLTGGEGMGLGTLEAAIHKVPIIYHDYGAPSEFLKDKAYSVKTQTFINAKNIDVKWGLVDLDDTVEKMLYVVNNKEEVLKFAEKAFDFVRDNIDWSIIFPKMLSVTENINKLFNKSKVLLKQIM
jgi:glycosyltransferase involved in cell wall biosynthesis